MTFYRVSHLIVDLGWDDFNLGVPTSCPSAQPLLPNSHQTGNNWTVENLKFKSTQLPNPVLEHMGHPVFRDGEYLRYRIGRYSLVVSFKCILAPFPGSFINGI